jgi:hypothetical protein
MLHSNKVVSRSTIVVLIKFNKRSYSALNKLIKKPDVRGPNIHYLVTADTDYE